jgi:hypothetical protein
MPGRTKEKDTSSQDDVNMDDAPTSAQPDAQPVGEEPEEEGEDEEQEEEQEVQRVRIVRQCGTVLAEHTILTYAALSCLAQRIPLRHSSSPMKATHSAMRCDTSS